MNTNMNLDAMRARMEAMALAAKGGPSSTSPADASAAGGVDFQSLLKNAINQVNDAQNTAQAKAQDFQMGKSDTSLEEVITSLQKANLSLQGMIAVRNKLVDAYKDITNIQV
jgi:flagellar hook-basal body complex protein FliE